MKRNLFVCLLALWMVLCLLPVTAQAAEGYEISAQIVGEDRGRVELSADRACAEEVVWLLAEPEEGWLVQIDGFCGTGEVWVSYAGLGSYAVTMPEGDVRLEIRFVPAEGALYPVTGRVNNSGWGSLTVHRSEAREGEWVVVEAAPRPGCVVRRVEALGMDGLPVKGGFVGIRDGVQIYEYCLPGAGVVVEGEFSGMVYPVAQCAVFVRSRNPGLRQWMPDLRFAALAL